MKAYLYYPSPAGLLELCEEKGFLRSILFCDENNNEESPTPLLEETLRQLEDYFAGTLTAFDLPLRLPPKGFRRDVCLSLMKVPFGETVSYKELAGLSDHPGASRAVGGVMAANELVIVIPCHRVIKSDGSLGNYSGGDGIDTKRWLLEHEYRHANKLK